MCCKHTGTVPKSCAAEIVEDRMSVIVEAITVIFRNATADALIAGGSSAIRDNPPNNTYRTDGILSAIGFMTPEDTEQFVGQLKGVGFRFIEKGKSIDIAVCDQNRGFTADCEWLGTDTDERGVRFCWLLGQPRGAMCVQSGWRFEQSLYTVGSFRPDDEPLDNLKFLRTENGTNVYLDKSTGKEIYTGRPFENKDDAHTIRTKALLFATAVKFTHDGMVADGWMSVIVNSEAKSSPHLIMRYRNQIGILFVEVQWNGASLTELDEVSKKHLLDKAQQMNAVPMVASLDFRGEPDRQMTKITEVEDCQAIQAHLNRNYLIHDLTAEHEWNAGDHDLDAEIELSDWESHDFGIQIVSQTLEKDGHKIEHMDADMDAVVQIVASIDGKFIYIVVETVRYPAEEAEFSGPQIRDAAEMAATRGADLKIASVSLASADDPFDPDETVRLPIYRGAGVFPRFTGLKDPQFKYDG
jgi:hypothetical protein